MGKVSQDKAFVCSQINGVKEEFESNEKKTRASTLRHTNHTEKENAEWSRKILTGQGGSPGLEKNLDSEIERQSSIVKLANKEQEGRLYHEYQTNSFNDTMLEAGDHVEQIKLRLSTLADNTSILTVVGEQICNFFDRLRTSLKDRVFRYRNLLTFLLEQQKKVCDLGIQLMIHGPSYCEVEGGPLKSGYRECLDSIEAKKDLVDKTILRHKKAQRVHRDDPDMIAEAKDNMDRAKAKYDIAIQRKDEILGDLRSWREDCDYKNVIQELVGPAIADNSAFPSESGEAKTDIESQEIKKAALESLDDALKDHEVEEQVRLARKKELEDRILAIDRPPPPTEHQAVFNGDVNSDGVPIRFFCAISHDFMRDPVKLSSGNIYDRPTILEWFSKGRATDPATNLSVDSELTALPELQAEILAYLETQSS